jgi:hypothetical protein
MTIKQLGGVFGRNPTFNDVTIEGQLTFDGDIDINSDLTIGGNLDVNGTIIADDEITIEKNTPAGVGPELYLHNTANDGNTGHAAEIRFNLRAAEATSRNALIGAKALGTYGSDPYIYFSTSLTDSGEPTERVKVLNTGNLELVSGNLVVASGSGIDFSATAGTGTSELFDDYEEGNWTPAPSSFINYTPSVQIGRYTKVGNLVTASFNLSWTSANAGSNQFVVSGLPFASSSTTNYASAAAIGGSDYLTASVQVFAHVQDNTTSIKFFTMNSGSTKSNLLCSSWNASGSTNNIVGTVSYIV